MIENINFHINHIDNDDENNKNLDREKTYTSSALVEKIKQELASVTIDIPKYNNEIKRHRETRSIDQNHYDFESDLDFSPELTLSITEDKKYYYRAYKYQAIGLLNPAPFFKVSLQDISLDSLRALLQIEPEERNYILKQAIGRIFEDVNSDLYHTSISPSLKVKFIDGSDYDYVYTNKEYDDGKYHYHQEIREIIDLILSEQENNERGFKNESIKNEGPKNVKEDENNVELESEQITTIEKKDKEKPKREFTTYKYSKIGKGNLHEAIFINDFPYFISYNYITKKIEVIDKIEENKRIIKPPEKEQYPYTQYEFANLDEVYRYVDFILNNQIDIDYLYNNSKSIISMYNHQEDYKLDLIAADVILSYFQDRFSTTHYNYFVGGNGSGKSSLADTFGAIGYRVVIMTDPTAPNLFRLLGIIEPAQCTMVLEEAERIDKSDDLMAMLKTGYSFNGKVPRINTITNKQEFYFSFCIKIIVSERSLNQSIARGLNDRIFLHRCIKGDPKYDIKEVLNPTDTGGPEKNKLLEELIDFRKLLLIYRLIHFKDPIPDIDIGIVGRDKELTKPLIQLFHNSEAQQEIIKNLQKILDLKNQKKQNTLEAALLPIVVNLISEHGIQFLFNLFWSSLKENIPGKEDEKKPNEYHTEDYGTIFRTTITNTLRDIFAVETKHTKKGNMLIFNPLVISKLTQQYNTTITLISNKIPQPYK
jgi:hypothetical protein